MEKLIIDPEFQSAIRRLSDEEIKQLEENIVADGEVHDPIITWKGIIVDGHHRWEIIQKHPEIPYKTKSVKFADRFAVLEWIYKNQLGRRNLKPEERDYLSGKMYEARKLAQGGDRRSEEFSTGQNVHLKSRRETKDGTAGQIGKELGMDGRTVRRNAKFAEGVDALKEADSAAAEKVLHGESGKSKTAVASFPKMSTEEKKSFVEEILNPQPKPKPVPKTPKTPKDDLARQIIEGLKADKPPAEDYDFVFDMELRLTNTIRSTKDLLVAHSTELTEELRNKIYAVLEKAETAISEMKGLVKR